MRREENVRRHRSVLSGSYVKHPLILRLGTLTSVVSGLLGEQGFGAVASG
jgi:hypothetical protein